MAATQHAIDLARAAASAAEDKLATKIVALDVSEQLALTDIFLLASAPNDRQVDAIVDEHRGQAARAGRQAGSPRGRAGRALGAHRLRRHRRARAARGGAQLLPARAPLEGLPGDRAVRLTWPTSPGGRRPSTPTPVRSGEPAERGRRCRARRAAPGAAPAADLAARPDPPQRQRDLAGPARHRAVRPRAGPGPRGGGRARVVRARDHRQQRPLAGRGHGARARLAASAWRCARTSACARSTPVSGRG